MLLRLSIERGHRLEHVLVDAQADAVVADLAVAVGLPSGTSVHRRQRGAAVFLDPSAPLGTCGLLDGDVLLPDPGPAFAPAPAPPASSGWRLRVVEGPDAGKVLEVPRGEAVLGRRSSVELPLTDVEVSRQHARLFTGHGAVAVEDCGSTNGTLVNGSTVPRRTQLSPGDRIGVGLTTLVVEQQNAETAAVRPDGEGGVVVNRRQSRRSPFSAPTVEVPPPPPALESRRFPWVAALAPLVVSGALVAVMHHYSYLLFALLSPVTLAANLWSERRGERGKARKRLADHAEALAAAMTAVGAAVDAERSWLQTAYPAGQECARLALDVSPRLWERDPEYAVDFLHVRLGHGDVPASVTVRSQKEAPVDRPVVGSAPLAWSLPSVRVLGIAGPEDLATELATSVIVQIAALHSPDDVCLTVLVDAEQDAEAWRWTQWLPHTWDRERRRLRVCTQDEATGAVVKELREVAAARGAARHASSGERSLPYHVVVLVGAARLRRRPDVAELLATGPAAGIYAVAVDDDALRLPEERRLTAVVGRVPSGATLHVDVAGEQPRDGVAELVPVPTAEPAARALAPLRRIGGSSPAAGLPSSVLFGDILGGLPGAGAVRAQWQREPYGRDTVPVGVGPDGVFSLDLVHTGPHALVAGMTGSGKSEFIQTWMASLALHNPPTALTFLFVEFKGIAAFRDLRHLPHCVGSITNLDHGAAARALGSLQAELRRRQRAFDAAGVTSISDYRRAGDSDPSLPALPRLLVVVDEFAEMKKALPDFVTGLVSIANTGRSLGVHLVLATQRTGSAVSTDIATNSGLRISLRANDDEDSRVLLDSPIAATIPQDLVGRAYARRGEKAPEPFQTAYVGARQTSVTVGVTVVRWPDGGKPVDAMRTPATAPAPAAADDLTDLQALVQTMGEAAGDVRPLKPFSDPLPDSLPLLSLPSRFDGSGTLSTFERSRGPAVGLRDDLEAQSLLPYVVPLLDGNVAVIGDGRSGRTTTLRTTAVSWALQMPPWLLHVHAIDGARGLSALVDLPHTGTVAAPESAHAARLLQGLAAEIGRRNDALQASGLGDLHEQWRLRPDEALPWVLLVVDRFESLAEVVDNTAAGAALEQVLSLGPSAGVTVLAAGDDTLLRHRWLRRFPVRVVHRMSTGVDAVAAGLPARTPLDDLPPGRAYDSSQGQQVQFGVIGDDPTHAAQNDVVRRVGAERRAAYSGVRYAAPVRLRSLPERVDADGLPAAPVPGSVPLGLGGDDAGPVVLPPDQLPLLVVGPQTSGRSTALRRVVRAWAAAGIPVTVVARAGSPLAQLVGGPVDVVRSDGPAPDWAALLSDPTAAVVVDDLDGAHVPDALTDRLGDGRPTCRFAGATAPMAILPRALATMARTGTLLLLTPQRSAARVYDVQLDQTECFDGPPGRGLLCRRGSRVPVQVAQDA